MKIVVIGGTGLIGSKLVANLTEQGQEVVPAAPKLGINTITGEGLAKAKAVGRIAVGAPVNRVVEIGGPEQFRFHDAIRRVLAAVKDPREVVPDPNARYFGIAVGERTLVPGEGASLGEIRLDDWLRRSPAAKTAAA